MRVLILSCGTGGGHNAAASAMKEALEARGHSADVLNPYTLKASQNYRRCLCTAGADISDIIWLCL